MIIKINQCTHGKGTADPNISEKYTGTIMVLFRLKYEEVATLGVLS
jgi:hypothetical protein